MGKTLCVLFCSCSLEVPVLNMGVQKNLKLKEIRRDIPEARFEPAFVMFDLNPSNVQFRLK